MFPFGEAIFPVGASVISAPDLLWRVGATGDEEAKAVARHLHPLAAHRGAALAYRLASPLDVPIV
jgi:hypothetical protein